MTSFDPSVLVPVVSTAIPAIAGTMTLIDDAMQRRRDRLEAEAQPTSGAAGQGGAAGKQQEATC